MCAGQAVVQFAQDISSQQTVAIKFFARDVDFATEAAMLTRVLHEPERAAQARLARFLPRVEAIRTNRNGTRTECVDRHSLPPCVVLERGDSLQEWSTRSDPAAVDHVARCHVVRSSPAAPRLRDHHPAPPRPLLLYPHPLVQQLLGLLLCGAPNRPGLLAAPSFRIRCNAGSSCGVLHAVSCRQPDSNPCMPRPHAGAGAGGGPPLGDA